MRNIVQQGTIRSDYRNRIIEDIVEDIFEENQES